MMFSFFSAMERLGNTFANSPLLQEASSLTVYRKKQGEGVVTYVEG